MTGRSFVDTNVLVYSVDLAEPEKRAIARNLLADRAEELVISAQVLSEFYVVATRRLREPLTEEEAAGLVEDFAALPCVVVDSDLVREGIAVSSQAHISYWDGLIVAAARTGRCETLLTEDLDAGADAAGVRIENPFAPGAQ